MSDITPKNENAITQENKSRLRSIQKFIRKLKPGNDLHRDDLVEGLATDNAHADSFDEDEKKFLKNILFLRLKRVEDVMVRRAQISAVNVKADFKQVCDAFLETYHSRLPVYKNTLDQTLGIVHIKDVFSLAKKEKNGQFNLKKIIHPPLFVPPSMKVTDLLRKMQEQRLHMAIVIDEHGGTNGLVSIEDLVEEIVGDIEDEHEKGSSAHPKMVQRRDGSIEVSADMSLVDLKERAGIELGSAHHNISADTIGSFVVSASGHLPQKGERIIAPSGAVIEVRIADLRRMRTLRIYPTSKTATVNLAKNLEHSSPSDLVNDSNAKIADKK